MNRGYYDNVIFHRVIKDFLMYVCCRCFLAVLFEFVHQRIVRSQGGDPTGTGRGGQSIYGCVLVWCFCLFAFRCDWRSAFLTCSKPFEDEITPKLKHTGAGVRVVCSLALSDRVSNRFRSDSVDG